MSNLITFGTDGWRAIIAENFTFANVERVAYAVGRYVQENYHQGDSVRVPVLVGYDTRFLAEKFANRVARVLIGMGVPAKVACRDVPTPAIAWAVQLEPTAGALQITASHNPPEYCGIKYIPDYAGPATNDITNQIIRHLNDIPDGYEAPAVDVPEFDPMPSYLETISEKVDLKRIKASGLKVAYDALYSTSRGYLDELLLRAGLKPKVMRDWRDPLFGGGMPEPKGEYLKELSRVVVEQGYDVGVATDGDADRFGVIDENGNYVMPNQLLALLTMHLFKNHGMKGAIVRTVATSHLLDRLAEMYGLELIETPVGFKYIGEMMRVKDVLIGGEESGGVSIKGHIPEKDGILANMLLVEMLAYEKKPLSAVWAGLLQEARLPIVSRYKNLHLNPVTQRALMETLTKSELDSIGGEKVQRVGRLDGLKFYLDEFNWLLVRPSGTEPLIRLYFEGTSPERVQRFMSDFEVQVEKILNKHTNQQAAVKA